MDHPSLPRRDSSWPYCAGRTAADESSWLSPQLSCPCAARAAHLLPAARRVQRLRQRRSCRALSLVTAPVILGNTRSDRNLGNSSHPVIGFIETPTTFIVQLLLDKLHRDRKSGAACSSNDMQAWRRTPLSFIYRVVRLSATALQAFALDPWPLPVPSGWGHGRQRYITQMKNRLGITAPLHPDRRAGSSARSQPVSTQNPHASHGVRCKLSLYHTSLPVCRSQG